MIGELLVKASIISQKQLDDCVRQSGMKRLHLGQMLMMAGYITPRDLQAATDAQDMLRAQTIDIEMAIKCLKISFKAGLKFPDVVNDQQAIDQERADSQVWTLGQLLHEAEVASQQQIDAAYQKSNSTNIPIGRILILNGVLNDFLLSTALDLLIKARDQICNRDEAIEAMRAAAGLSPPSPLTQNLLLPLTTRRPRLGQLMFMAGIMGETDVANAVEFGLTYNMMIGQVMVEQGYVSPQIVEAALELQNYIEAGQVDADRAGEVLQKVYHNGGNISDLITSLQPVLRMSASEEKPRLTFEKLLVLSRVVSQDQIHEAFDICRQTPEALAKILCLTGFIEGHIHDAVLRCHELLDQGRLTQDDALVALDYCFNHPEAQPTFDDALYELGWSDTGLAASEHAQLAHDQEFDPDRTADGMPAISQADVEAIARADREAAAAASSAASEGSPAFNLLDHFGLNEGEEAESQSQSQDEINEAPQQEEESQTPAEYQPTRDEESWPEESGQYDSLGVATTDTPVISFADRVLDDPMSNIAEPKANNGKLAHLLDRISDGEESKEEETSTNGNGQGGAPIGENKQDDARPVGATGRARPDKETLRQQEMTLAPQKMKIDESAILSSRSEDDSVVEPETDKKAAVGAAMYRLAESYFEQGDFAEAQKIYEKILAIRQAELGSQHIDLVDDLNKLAEVLWVQGNFRQAEPFVRRGVTILESTHPVDGLRLAEGLRILAGLFFQQGKFEPSIPFLEHALLLKKASLGDEHRDVGNLLREYAKLLKKMGRTAEAEKHYMQAKKILAKSPTEPEA